jgi:hypothetical protein
LVAVLLELSVSAKELLMEQIVNQNIALRPLSGGMRLDKPPQQMEPGEFLDLVGVLPTQEGLKRSPLPQLAFSGPSATALPDAQFPIRDAFYLDPDGSAEIVVVGQTHLYKAHPQLGYIPIDDTVTIDVPRRTVPDWTVWDSLGTRDLILVDGSTSVPWTYDGSDLEAFTFSGESELSSFYATPNAVQSFADRLWVGGGNILQWSEIGLRDRFQTVSYYSFPSSGTIQAIVPLGSLLVVFFSDAVYFGRPTSILDLPYIFTRIDSGNIGIVGQRAWCTYDDAIFFVGQDDVYYLSSTSSIQSIGSPVKSQMLRDTSNAWNTRVVLDPQEDRLIFGIGHNSNLELWNLVYPTKAWSRESRDVQGLFALRPTSSNYWKDKLGVQGTVNGVVFTDWASLRTAQITWYDTKRNTGNQYSVYIQIDNALYSLASDLVGEVDILIESGDYDLGAPDQKKTINRLGMKLNDILQQTDIRATVMTSTNRGRDWKFQDTSILEVLHEIVGVQDGEDEDWTDFRSTGSLFRFKLQINQVCEDFTISEITFRGKVRGYEVR